MAIEEMEASRLAIRKCPRCDLNYILDDAPFCPVCIRDMKGDQPRATVIEPCSLCNENPALPGKDLCLFCLKEMQLAESDAETEEGLDDSLGLEGASEMEEIILDDEDDIPSPELGEIDRELSLDEVLEEEEMQDMEAVPEEDM